jgi:NTP pyrophosphatase (non-canonical NTP hydrolase)
MYMNTRTPTYTDALNLWGEDFQKSMFHEEIGEVLTAMSHEKRGRCGKEAVLEELADLQIMLNQMVVLYGTDDEFKDIINAKLTRLVNRIERSQI